VFGLCTKVHVRWDCFFDWEMGFGFCVLRGCFDFLCYKISTRTKCLQQHGKFKSHHLFSSAYAVYEFICLINLRLLLNVIVVQRVYFFELLAYEN
jgi:hypothetical protein